MIRIPRILTVIALISIISVLAIPAYAEDKGLSISGVFEDTLETLKLEEMRQGTAKDYVNEGRECYTFTKPFWKLKTKDPKSWLNERLALEIGYTSTDKLMGGGSVNLLKVGDFTDIPLIELLRLDVGGWLGWGRIQVGGGMEGNNEWAGGAYFTLLKLTK